MLSGSSVARLLAEENQESSPLTVIEEIREQARLESVHCELVDQGSSPWHPTQHEGRGKRGFFREISPRAAEQLARNGCGAPLRC
jgi:hypothetical protein